MDTIAVQAALKVCGLIEPLPGTAQYIVKEYLSTLSAEPISEYRGPTGEQWNAALDVVRNGRAATEDSIQASLNDPAVQAGVACLRQWRREIEQAVLSKEPKREDA